MNFLKNINWKILLIGISIPVFFCILIQLSYILEKINPVYGFILNLDTFIAFFLIFFASIFLAMFLKTNVKTGVLYGVFVGFISGIVIITIMTTLVLLTTPEVHSNQILTQSFGVFIIISSIFQILTGSVGGALGSLLIKEG